MRSRRRKLVLAAAPIAAAGLATVAILSPGGGPGHPAHRPLPAPGPTIVQDDAEVLHRPTARVRTTMQTLRALGVDWLRVTANWSFIAPSPASPGRPRFDATDPAAYPPGSWAKLDRAVRAAHAAGLDVMIDVAFWAPRWAVAQPSRPSDRQRNDIDAAAFGQFATAVARRYSGHYHRLPAAVGFTIWNEPNFRVFLLPQWRRAGPGWEVASADEYRAMVYAAVPAIRRQAPRALVLIGGTAAKGTDTPATSNDAVPPLRFLRALACVDDSLQPIHTGACASFHPLPGDGWAHHPYAPRVPPDRSDPQPDTASIADMSRLTDLLARLQAAGRIRNPLPVYLTEFGYETNPPDPTQPATLADQARWLPEAEAIAHGTPGVRGFAQFLLRDLPIHAGRTAAEEWSDFQSGLELPTGEPKPAMRSFAYALAVRRREGGRIEAFVHVRPGHGRRRVRIVARAPGGSSSVRGEARTDQDGFATLALTGDPGATFRLELADGDAWKTVGAAVAGAS
ncbi:MAG: cellulase family glycosylhydrolase [Actinomycetota bacterium]|nr:cellulase family glycosylhydrolase [Actinomycetota bacterium]